MANRPVIDIAVNTTEFERFTTLFNAYSAKLDEMPESWQKLAESMGEAGDATQNLASGALSGKEALALAGAQAAIVAEALENAVKAQHSLGDASHGTNKRMGELAKTAKGLASDIAGVGKWVLKLGAGALAGLGIGALLGGFGLNELAGAAFGRTRTAGGLGLSPGQLASFNVNAQSYLGASALQGAASAQLSYQSAPFFQMLGIDFKRAQSMNAGDLAFEMLKGAVANWNAAQKTGIPPGSSPLVRAYEELGGNLEDVRRAAAAGLPAVNAAQGAYHRDIRALGFDAQTAAAWSTFKIQLDRAGMEIETVFINKLGPLVPEFTQLSKDVITAIAGFVNSKEFGTLMASIKDGLKSFLSWLEGPDAKKMADNLKLVADEIFSVAEKLKWLIPKGPAPLQIPAEPGGHKGKMRFDPGSTFWVDDQTGLSYNAASNQWIDKQGNVYDPKSKKWVAPWWKQWQGALGSAWNAITNPGAAIGAAISSHSPVNNPLDVTTGQDAGGLLFAHYSSIAEGIRAGAALLEKYPANWGAKTIAAAIPIWSGLTNDPKAAAGYIANVEKWSGVSRNANIAELTRAQLAAVVAAMSRMEGTAVVTPEQAMQALYGTPSAAKKHADRIIKALKTSKPLQIVISNSTSARVAVSANAIATG